MRLADAISCLAVSPNGNILAICPNSNDIVIYSRGHSGWEQTQILKGHEQLVSGLDWHEERLLSCSHDRNAIVWARRQGGDENNVFFKPELVITKLGKSCLCCSWSPNGKKFAIGSGEASVCVAAWDEGKELWAPRVIKKKHSSSVTALAWHPSGALLATTSTDSHVRIFDAVISAVDGKLDIPALKGSRFGNCLMEVPTGCGWGLGISWSPSGTSIGYCGQMPAQVGVLQNIDIGTKIAWEDIIDQKQMIGLPDLPLKSLVFVKEDMIAGGGFDGKPVILKKMDGKGSWMVTCTLKEEHIIVDKVVKEGDKKELSSVAARIRKFEASTAAEGDRRSKEVGAALGHTNCIMGVCKLENGSIISGGLDGRVLRWNIP